MLDFSCFIVATDSKVEGNERGTRYSHSSSHSGDSRSDIDESVQDLSTFGSESDSRALACGCRARVSWQPVGAFSFSCFSTFGVCDLSFPARARDP